jgi:hexokinase
LERSWPILSHLKSENADGLFAWIGGCIAAVVEEGCGSLGVPRDEPLAMGVTFSFPMEQVHLSEAKLMSMGKGFGINSNLDLGAQLLKGYQKNRTEVMPQISITAIANDSVSTLVSAIYEFRASGHQKAVMGLICGTGSNATLTMKASSLHTSKRPSVVGDANDRIAINTEWSINGSAPPMRRLGLISEWDDRLSQSVESPGFQPLEYMTAGRYLGELGRIVLVDFLTKIQGFEKGTLPAKLSKQFEPYNTTFLSHYRPGGQRSLLEMLSSEFPASAEQTTFRWTDETADALYHIARAIGVRAAGIVAAATVGLLQCAEELPLPKSTNISLDGKYELVVGYTGGCITNFQDYLVDCQEFLDDVIALEYGEDAPVRVVLRPCHDGGIKGAGILVPAALSIRAKSPKDTRQSI